MNLGAQDLMPRQTRMRRKMMIKKTKIKMRRKKMRTRTSGGAQGPGHVPETAGIGEGKADKLANFLLFRWKLFHESVESLHSNL